MTKVLVSTLPFLPSPALAVGDIQLFSPNPEAVPLRQKHPQILSPICGEMEAALVMRLHGKNRLLPFKDLEHNVAQVMQPA